MGILAIVSKSCFKFVLFVKIFAGLSASSAIILIAPSVVGGEIRRVLEVKAKSENLSLGCELINFFINTFAAS